MQNKVASGGWGEVSERADHAEAGREVRGIEMRQADAAFAHVKGVRR